MIENNIDVIALNKLFTPASFVCNSGRHNYFVINCDKKIYKCELNVDNNDYCIGYINSSSLYIDHFDNLSYSTPAVKVKCTSCFLYALCLGISCPLRKYYNKPCLLKSDYLIDDYMDVLLYYYEKNLQKV